MWNDLAPYTRQLNTKHIASGGLCDLTHAIDTYMNFMHHAPLALHTTFKAGARCVCVGIELVITSLIYNETAACTPPT